LIPSIPLIEPIAVGMMLILQRQNICPGDTIKGVYLQNKTAATGQQTFISVKIIRYHQTHTILDALGIDPPWAIVHILQTSLIFQHIISILATVTLEAVTCLRIIVLTSKIIQY
jgi:hypothetical protein